MRFMGRCANTTRGEFDKLCRAISDAIGKFVRAVRERWSVLTVTIVGICIPVYAMAWYLDINGNFAANIAVTGIVTAIPIIHLFSPSERLTFNSTVVWFSIVSWLTLVLFVGDAYDWRFLSFSSTLALLAFPYGWVFWQIARYEWLLYVGLTLALLGAMTYWGAALIINSEGFEFLLVPLPIILSIGVPWAYLASRILKSARKRKNRRISGPGLQVLAMTMLFFPVAIIAMSFPTGLGLSGMWSNVSLALIGILLSAVISEPLRRMLIEWANLAPYRD